MTHNINSFKRSLRMFKDYGYIPFFLRKILPTPLSQMPQNSIEFSTFGFISITLV